MGSIFDIIDGHVNEMFNANEGLYEERMKICKECPLYKETPVGPICNPKLYINKEGKTSAYKKMVMSVAVPADYLLRLD